MAAVGLKAAEGGLNLAMPPSTMLALFRLGVGGPAAVVLARLRMAKNRQHAVALDARRRDDVPPWRVMQSSYAWRSWARMSAQCAASMALASCVEPLRSANSRVRQQRRAAVGTADAKSICGPGRG